MIGTIIDTDPLKIVVSVSSDGKQVAMTGASVQQILTPSDALRLADWLAHAAREALINDVEDIIDVNTRWV